ncbi:hypothetical protein D3C76_1615370 [compost metagenome]
MRVGVGAVVEEVPTKETAQQWRVQGDLRRIQAGTLGDVGAEHVWRLVGQPDLQRAIGVEACQGGGRLQLRVVEKLVVVGRLDLGLGAVQRLGEVALYFFVTRRAGRAA